ncbi:hypothetical protein Patl1_02252 [Pistacia atlantica]|uniref:Uncharacterized protein n=1 Tax=Pistacia atlantica TaxID=434234 RepID=A0ACC1C5Y1_9ROSI|nr:hypothetical protein Patl1_02252 [Pistacia atlantica]
MAGRFGGKIGAMDAKGRERGLPNKARIQPSLLKLAHTLSSHSPYHEESETEFGCRSIFPILFFITLNCLNFMDLEIEQTAISEKLNQNEVDMCDVDFGIDEDSPEGLIGDGKVEMDSKGKAKICYDEKWQYQDKDASASDPGKTSTSGSIISNNLNSSNSELSYHDNDDDCDDCGDDVSDYDDNDNFLYEDEDDYITMQSQFDNVDLPPGVEASLPWLKDLAPRQLITPSVTTISSVPDLSESKRKSTILDSTETKRKTTISDLDENKSKLASSSSSTDPEEASSNEKEEIEESGGMQKLHFKLFDMVGDFSDHHYSRMGFLGDQQVSFI